MVDEPFILLASRSPRRAALLREAGYAFEQVSPHFDDPPQPQADPTHRSPADLATHLAQQKAHSVLQTPELKAHAIVLAADTIVVGPHGHLLGQPATPREARDTLQTLVGQTHTVHTGVCLLSSSVPEPCCFSDASRVHLGHVTQDQIDSYIASNQWQGKAGGYNLFELQDQWPFTVTGDPTTVVGLPMQKLAHHLSSYWATLQHADNPPSKHPPHQP